MTAFLLSIVIYCVFSAIGGSLWLLISVKFRSGNGQVDYWLQVIATLIVAVVSGVCGVLWYWVDKPG